MALQTEGNAPVKKVAAGGIAGAAATILVYVLNSYVLPSAKPIPAEIAAAITTLLSFAVAYLTPPGEGERAIDPDAAEAVKAKGAGA